MTYLATIRVHRIHSFLQISHRATLRLTKINSYFRICMFFQLNINNIEPRHTSLARHHQQTRQWIWKVAWEWLWTVTDLISVFLRADPFSLRFPYIFRLLNFYFDTEYYAILMSNSFTLIHFRTLARPLQFLLFAFHSKQINIMIYFYFYVFENNDSNPSFHEEQLPAMENDL